VTTDLVRLRPSVFVVVGLGFGDEPNFALGGRAVAKAYVTLDGTLLRIDRVQMASQRDRVYYSGKHKAHGVSVQVTRAPCLLVEPLKGFC
jgi:hypothetical protein